MPWTGHVKTHFDLLSINTTSYAAGYSLHKNLGFISTNKTVFHLGRVFTKVNDLLTLISVSSLNPVCL